MQLHKRLIMLLALGVSVTASASTDTDLWRAADKGDSSAVEAALKAGANVNARFDIGRTALIIAAMKGRVSAIEKLLDAGADMYMRDSNGHDALTIAAEYEQPTVVRTLLNRGFDPSLNDWRALRLLPEERKNNKFAESIGPKQREIRQMLLERRAKGGTTPLQTAAATASTNSNPPNGVSSDASPVVIDISGQKVTPEIFKTAAT